MQHWGTISTFGRKKKVPNLMFPTLTTGSGAQTCLRATANKLLSKRRSWLRKLIRAVALSVTALLIITLWALERLHRKQPTPDWVTDGSAEPIWPEDAPYSDRIEGQLRFRPSKLRDGVLLISLFEGFSRWDLPNSEAYRSLFDECPINNCRASFDTNDMEKANAILFRNSPPHMPNRRPDQILIFSSLEAPPHTTAKNFVNTVNWTATYRRDSDIVTPYGKLVKTATQEEVIVNLTIKTRLAAWFVSNCYTNSRREYYVSALEQHMPVDKYGHCGNKRCKKSDPNCWNLLRKYKFYIAFENARCQDYITEKLFENALRYNAVPVVMGPPKWQYEQVMPSGSFIHVEDFASPKALAEHLKALAANDTAYMSFFAWKKDYKLLDTKFWCRLCALLNQPRAKVYPSIEHWWNPPGTCATDQWWS
uniref:Fucosyltransferase n=1 Tax=Trichuris muris TaxID=70415 RepID=A0A5S6QG94_TRIMR